MASSGGILSRITRSRDVERWRNTAADAQEVNLDSLRASRDAARALRGHLDTVLHAASERLALPQNVWSNFAKPTGSDWAWRPDIWRGPLGVSGVAPVQAGTSVGHDVTLFHDCPRAEITARHHSNLRESDLAPYGLVIDVLGFDGGFFSAVIDLPPDAVAGLKRAHILQIDAVIEFEVPLEVFARLNVQHGPNTEQVPQEMHMDGSNGSVAFDLAYSNLNEKRVEKAWVDLIFENPRMNRIDLRDVTLSRRLRASL